MIPTAMNGPQNSRNPQVILGITGAGGAGATRGLSWGSGLGRGGLTAAGLTGSGFAATAFGMTLGAGLLGFTVTFDVAGNGLGLAGGRTTFFLGAAGL